LYDSGAEINLIRDECAETLGHAQKPVKDRPVAKFLDDNNLCINGAYDLTVGCSDANGVHKQVDHQRFWSANFGGYDIVLGYPWLQEADPKIRFSTREFE
jgi:hypothetical protein